MRQTKYTTGILRRRRAQGGNALMELALSLPPLGLLLVGAMDFGRLFYAQITVASAARCGAQYGMQTAVTNDSGDLTGVTSTATQVCYCNAGGT